MITSGAVAALDAHGLDVGARGLRHTQPVEGQQGDQRVLSRGPETGGDERGTELIAIQRRRVRLVVKSWPADVDGRGVIQQSRTKHSMSARLAPNRGR